MKILAFGGSLRKGSLSLMALHFVASIMEEAGIEVEVLDLKDFEMPNYSQDIEDRGLPEVVEKFKQKIKDSDGLLISSPEYNHSVPGYLKNMIDWASRNSPELKDVFKGKIVGLVTSSDGSFGGIRARTSWLPTFATLGLLTYPTQMPIPTAQDKFAETGEITDPKLKERLTKFAQDFVEFTERHSK